MNGQGVLLCGGAACLQCLRDRVFWGDDAAPPAALRSRKLSVGGWTSSPKTCQGRRSRALSLASPTLPSREVKGDGGVKARIPHASLCPAFCPVDDLHRK